MNKRSHERKDTHGVLLNWQSPVAIEPTALGPTSAATRETEFSLLPDGRMLDLMRDSRQPSNLGFLVWQDGTIRQVPHLEHEGELFAPPRIDSTLVSALRLPTQATPCPEAPELFTLIMNQIATYVDITSESLFLVTAFIVTTWFADRIWQVPYLSICGPPESGKTTLMRVLHCLCCRAIHASAITPASIYRLAQIRPTLLLDEAEFTADRSSRDLQRLLRGGNRQGSRVLCNGKAFENFGPKVLASRVPSNDAALMTRTINITMTPSNRDVPALGTGEEQDLSDTMQAMLQSFRFAHYKTIATSLDPEFLKFSPRLRDNARALAVGMFGNPELQEGLVRALEPQLQSAQLDRFNEPEWVVMLALFDICHAVNDQSVQNLTTEANRILRQNGESLFYSPKKVGQILNKSLGVPTRRRGEGYWVDLTLAIRRKIHSQAKAMGIKRSDIEHWASVKSGLAGQPCSLCSEFGMMMDHEGRRLLTLDELLQESKPCTSCGQYSHLQQCPRCNMPRDAELRNPPGEPTSSA